MRYFWANRPFRMFDGESKVEQFSRFSTVFPVRVVRASASPKQRAKALAEALPLDRYRFDDEWRSVGEFLSNTETTALLVSTPQGVVHELFAEGLSEATRWPLWSVSKSIVSLLVGCAVQRCALDLAKKVADYVPGLRGTGYGDVSVLHVLQMRSGVRWDENYADAASDIRRSQLARLSGGSQDEFSKTLPSQYAPGTVHRYNTIDTEVVGQVLRAITGASLSSLLEQWLWEPLGAQDDAYWVVDGCGVEWAGSGLIASARDAMKVARLVADGGRYGGEVLVEKSWIDSSTRVTELKLSAGHLNPGSALGFGYHWWLTRRGCCAIGIYNQFLYVDRATGLTITKFSANRGYAASPAYDEATYRHEEHVALFEALASALEDG